MDEFDYPVVHCPKCGKGQADMDGFGFIACLPDGCGYCKHVSAYKADDGNWYCGLCSDRLNRATDNGTAPDSAHGSET